MVEAFEHNLGNLRERRNMVKYEKSQTHCLKIAKFLLPFFFSENDLRSKLAQRGDLFLSEISEQLERCSKNSELFLNS